MREEIEFRIPERHASGHLPEDLGERLGETVRKVVLDMDDPWVPEIGRLDQEAAKTVRVLFFSSWTIRRYYSRREINEARVFHLKFKRIFEPAGEECGTEYDEGTACPSCGSGAKQITPLFLNGRRLPKRVDFAKTIAGEIVVSRRVAELFQDKGLSGAEFEAVRLSNKNGAESPDWFQPILRSKPVDFDRATRFGSNPFDNEQYGRCSQGDLAGLNILSECWISGATYDGADLVRTKQFVGGRSGLLRPEPLLLVSPRLWTSLQELQPKGCSVEVAHFAY